MKEKIENLKKENFTLRERLDEIDSGWVSKRDFAWRNNPVTKRFEQYGFPLDFDEEKVRDLHYVNEKRYMFHFRYYFTNDNFKEFDIPESLYEILKKRRKEKIDVSSIKTVEEMKEYIYSIDKIPRGQYFTK